MISARIGKYTKKLWRGFFLRQKQSPQQKTSLSEGSLTVTHSNEFAPDLSKITLPQRNDVVNSRVDLGGIAPPRTELTGRAPHLNRPTLFPSYHIFSFFIGLFVVFVGFVYLLIPFPAAAQTPTIAPMIFGSDSNGFFVKSKTSGQVMMRIDPNGNMSAMQKPSATSANLIYNGGFEDNLDAVVYGSGTTGSYATHSYRVATGWEQNFDVDSNTGSGTVNQPICDYSCQYYRDNSPMNVSEGQAAVAIRAIDSTVSTVTNTTNPPANKGDNQATGKTASLASMPFPVSGGMTYQTSFDYKCGNFSSTPSTTTFTVSIIYYAANNSLLTNTYDPTSTTTFNAYRGRSGTTFTVASPTCSIDSTGNQNGGFTKLTPVTVTVPATGCSAGGISDGANNGTVNCGMARLLIEKPAGDQNVVWVDNIRMGQNIGSASTQMTNASYISAGSFGSNATTGDYTFPASVIHSPISAPGVTTNKLYNVSGNLYWNGSAVSLGGSTVSGSSGYLSKFTAANAIGNSQLYESGTSVGIGTTSPGYKLDVAGGAIRALDGVVNGATTGTGLELYFDAAQSGGNVSSYNRTASTWQPLRLRSSYVTLESAGTEVLRATGGNVGIGTTGPLSKLDVNGGVAIGTYAGSTAAPTNGLIVSGGVLGIGTAGKSTVTTADSGLFFGAGGSLQYRTSGVNQVNLGRGIYFDSTANAYKYLTSDYGVFFQFDQFGGYNIWTAPSGTAGNTPTITPRFSVQNGGDIGLGGAITDVTTLAGSSMVIKSGNVGIGTTGPAYKLDVAGTSIVSKFGTDPAVIAVGDIGSSVNAFLGGYYAAGSNSSTIYFGQNVYFNGSAWVNPAAAANTSLFLQQGGTHYWHTGGAASGTGTARMSLSNAGGLSFGAAYAYTNAGAGNMIITGNVGIGTSAPISKLSVLGNLAVGATYGAITAPTSGVIIEGNVGIGTTGPTSKLSVIVPGTNTTATVDIQGQGGSGGATLTLGSTTDGAYKFNIAYDGNSGDSIFSNLYAGDGFLFKGGTTTRAVIGVGGDLGLGGTITSPSTFAGASVVIKSGNVGIGTTGPTQQLQLTENMQMAAGKKIYFTDTASQIYESAGFRVDASQYRDLYLSAGGNNGIFLQTFDTSWKTRGLIDINGNVWLGGTAANTSPTMAIQANGNVGIGTTGPGAKLEILSPTGQNASLKISSTDTDQPVSVNLSPGTASVAYLYGLGSAYTTSGRFIQSSTILDSSGAGGLSLAASNTAGVIRFYTNANNERVRIDNTGNVGIGTTSPGYKLDVAGAVRSSAGGFIFPDGTTQNSAAGSGPSGGPWTRVSPNVYLSTGTDNVGIGTTGPGEKLEVTGSVRVTGEALANVASAGTLAFGSGLAKIYSFGADSSTFGGFDLTAVKSNGTPTSRLRIDSTGNVGIGTTNPGALLHVNGNAVVGVQTGTSDGGLSIGANILNVGSPSKLTTTAITTPETALRIFRAGTVGTKWNPSADFQIGTYTVGAGALSKLTLSLGEGNTHTPDTSVMTWQSNGNVGIGTTAPVYPLEVSSGTGRIRITSTTNSINSGIDFSAKGASGTAGQGGVYFYGHETAGSRRLSLSGDNANEQLTILSGGNVGIGTTSPGYKLDVAGAVRSSAGGFIFPDGTTQNSAAGSGPSGGPWTRVSPNVYLSTGTDNVGIGTTSPSRVLQVHSTNTDSQVYISSAAPDVVFGDNAVFASATNKMYLGMATGAGHFLANTVAGDGVLYTVGAGGMLFGTNSTEKMRITNAGNVGIGTTGPGQKLEVAGGNILASGGSYQMFYGGANRTVLSNIAANAALRIGDSAFGDFVFASGNVGIGTTGPGTKLDIIQTTTSTTFTQNAKSSLTVSPSATSTDTYEGFRGQVLNGGTNNIGEMDGIFGYTLASANANVSTLKAVFGQSQISPTTGTITNAYGVYGDTTRTSGTLTSGYGVYGLARGAMTSGYGLYADVGSYGGSSPTTSYGLYIDSLEGSTTYGIYQAGTSDKNYFGGNVGIGTTGPTQLLQLQKNQNSVTQVNVINTTSGTAAGTGISFTPSGSNGELTSFSSGFTTSGIYVAGGLLLHNPNYELDLASSHSVYGKIRFFTAGTADANERMRITTAGNVGIGTTSPNAKLEVSGTMSTGDETGIRLTNTAGRTWRLQSGISGVNQNYFSIFDVTAGASRLAIETNGYVGIGNTSPTISLDIGATANGDRLAIRSSAGSAWAHYYSTAGNWIEGTGVEHGAPTNEFGIRDQGAGVTRLLIDTSGNVGIGTTGPGSKLDVAGIVTLSGSDTITANQNTIGNVSNIFTSGRRWEYKATNSYLKLTNTAATPKSWTVQNRDSDNALDFTSTDTGSVLFLTQAGGVGIGTATPGTAGLAIMNGNVGIGTTSPAYKLDVTGSMRVTGTIYGTVNGGGGNNTGATLTQTQQLLVAADTSSQGLIPAGYSAYIQGHVRVGGNVVGTGADVAEKFAVVTSSIPDRAPAETIRDRMRLEPGDVVVIAANLQIAKSEKAFDRKVVGVISTSPFIIMAEKRGGENVAMTGSTPVKVTGKVSIGDLLTTSDVPGHAMACNLDPGSSSRSNDPGSYEKCSGAIIGKALEDSDGADKTITMLVMMR